MGSVTGPDFKLEVGMASLIASCILSVSVFILLSILFSSGCLGFILPVCSFVVKKSSVTCFCIVAAKRD